MPLDPDLIARVECQDLPALLGTLGIPPATCHRTTLQAKTTELHRNAVLSGNYRCINEDSVEGSLVESEEGCANVTRAPKSARRMDTHGRG